jgi:hypothetical protein
MLFFVPWLSVREHCPDGKTPNHRTYYLLISLFLLPSSSRAYDRTVIIRPISCISISD